MSDGGLRDLERRWAQTGDAGDREALERARARARGISPGVRRLAEWLRDGRARWEEVARGGGGRARWSVLESGWEEGPFAMVELSGTLDSASLQPLTQVFAALKAQEVRWVYMDLSALKYVISTGLGSLVKWADELKERGGGLVLVRLPAKVRIVLEMLGLEAFFGMHKADLGEAADWLERGRPVGRLAQEVFGAPGGVPLGPTTLEGLRERYRRTGSAGDGQAFYRTLGFRDAHPRPRLRAAAWLGCGPAQAVLRGYDVSLLPPRGPRWPWGRSLASMRIDAECGLALAQGRFDAAQLEEGVVGLRGPEAPSRWLLVFGEVRWRGSLEAIAEVLRGFAAERGGSGAWVRPVGAPGLEAFDVPSVDRAVVLGRLEAEQDPAGWGALSSEDPLFTV